MTSKTHEYGTENRRRYSFRDVIFIPVVHVRNIVLQ